MSGEPAPHGHRTGTQPPSTGIGRGGELGRFGVDRGGHPGNHARTAPGTGHRRWAEHPHERGLNPTRDRASPGWHRRAAHGNPPHQPPQPSTNPAPTMSKPRPPQRSQAARTELATLQAAWLRAAHLPDGLTIPCGDMATAYNIRFRLYNAVKAVREGEGDPGLAAAVDALKASAQDNPPRVVLSRKVAVDIVSAALEASGMDLAEIKTAEELEAEASLQRMQELLASGQGQGQPQARAVEQLWPQAQATAPSPEPRVIDPAQVPLSEPSTPANPFFRRGDKPGQSF
jgi:hypothetical protein